MSPGQAFWLGLPTIKCGHLRPRSFRLAACGARPRPSFNAFGGEKQPAIKLEPKWLRSTHCSPHSPLLTQVPAPCASNWRIARRVAMECTSHRSFAALFFAMNAMSEGASTLSQMVHFFLTATIWGGTLMTAFNKKPDDDDCVFCRTVTP